jgi:PKD repeat protein
MTKYLGLFALSISLFLGACGGDEEVPAPIACYLPKGDTSLIVGSTMNFASCSENYESLVWKVNGGVETERENLYASFSQAGVYEITLEVTNSEGVVATQSQTVAVGYPCIKEIRVIQLNASGFNPLFPKWSLSLNGTDYNKSWTKTISGTYKDVTSLPQSFIIENHTKFNLGDTKWELKGGLTWNGSPVPSTGTTEFHAVQSLANGMYQLVIPGTVALEIIPVFEP